MVTQEESPPKQKQARTKAEARDLFPTKTRATKHSLLEQRRWPRPLSLSRKKSRKSEDQAEHKRTQPEAVKICICATRANKTVRSEKY